MIRIQEEDFDVGAEIAALRAGRRYLSGDLNRLWTRASVERIRAEGPDPSVPEEAELAGVQGAVRGSLLTLIVTLVLSFPIGVAAALLMWGPRLKRLMAAFAW